MKILVLATDYPDNDRKVTLMYIHTRNKYYVQNGLNVTVLNFSTKNNYTIDGVKVITQDEYKKNNDKYDILISHAPNLRNHYLFIKKYENNFSNIIFFFHGHEVLKVSEIYPPDYEYLKSSSKLSIFIRNTYDIFKLKVWKKYFIRNLSKLYFVFVSNWMYEMFLKYVGISDNDINNRKYIIYNSVGKVFETNYYNSKTDKEYDFITIRNNIDGSKYCIDIVTKIAKSNPKYKFCVVGKGDFFKYNNKPENLEWINKNLSHDEIITYLNKARCALMPTRTDAQGVMACEMATFGIPLITSNISVCKEVFGIFNNVGYINNEDDNIDIGLLYENIINNMNNKKITKYFSDNTIGKEVSLIKDIIRMV